MTASPACPLPWLLAALLLGPAAFAQEEEGAKGTVTISTDFPGGNVEVKANAPGRVELAPDLRGDQPWFYWYFSATVETPGRVAFVFPDEVIGFANGAIGKQGPAIQETPDGPWRWMGTADVLGPAFVYDFAEAGGTVRFAVTIPYTEANLAGFLKEHAGPHLHAGVLTQSRGGREVELLRIGEPGPGPDGEPKAAVLFTCRHHAAETMASFVLEGLMREALSDSDAGQAFREQFVLYVVPFVDKDGVEAGDQGKNRRPFDHNRDYRETSLYPEVQAIRALQPQHGFQYVVDLHCPTLVMGDHQVAYFVGYQTLPRNNQANVAAWAKAIAAAKAEDAPVGPLNWLRAKEEDKPTCSRWFGAQPGMVMSATFEYPFAPPKAAADPPAVRDYGAAMLRAFVATEFAR
ncbi:M14 family zinc carboxypeptidase [Alienimonas californiensis]|uniref:Zinc carboxypeptidase n=1 Tax=Alienimonas californiensis TaxID=2527989 RepID=A0A517P551_9PLAN|nr:M14 family zinc carboxypeptidase [Alienimonas californiensis]QDT14508.1 Zinc carboxypeptidase [Alienimonas californiensis]